MSDFLEIPALARCAPVKRVPERFGDRVSEQVKGTTSVMQVLLRRAHCAWDAVVACAGLLEAEARSQLVPVAPVANQDDPRNPVAGTSAGVCART